MKNNVVSAVVGFVFAMGLTLSGMTQPQKVIGFLDVFGSWDPSLIFVMAGAIIVHALFYRFIRKKKTPLLSEKWHIPNRKEFTPGLIFGSLIFGFGWGLGGYCPGPGLTALATLEVRPFLFVISMIVGMIIFNFVDRKLLFKK